MWTWFRFLRCLLSVVAARKSVCGHRVTARAAARGVSDPPSRRVAGNPIVIVSLRFWQTLAANVGARVTETVAFSSPASRKNNRNLWKASDGKIDTDEPERARHVRCGARGTAAPQLFQTHRSARRRRRDAEGGDTPGTGMTIAIWGPWERGPL